MNFLLVFCGCLPLRDADEPGKQETIPALIA